jgi:polyisoprenoid-binding protein YceI
MKRSLFVLAAAPLVALSPLRQALRAQQPAGAITWTVDPTHSELTFRIRHFVSKVRGTFSKWNGTITGDPKNWAGGSVDVTIDAASITTNNAMRDNDLRSANFFEAEKYPTLKFRSTKVEVKGDDVAITGDLTIRDVTKSVVLKGKYLGVTPEMQGGARVGFEASTTINRLDWGVKWNRIVEGGGTMLGDEVEIAIGIEAARAPGAAANQRGGPR